MLAKKSTWHISGKTFAFLVNILSTIILLNYIGPEKYGIFIFILVIINFFASFSTLNLESYLIFKPDYDKIDYSISFSVIFLLNLFFIGVLVLASPWLNTILETNQAVLYVLPMSIALLFHSLGRLQAAQLQKKLYFEKLSVIHMAISVISNVLAIILVLMYHNIWALVARYVCAAVLLFVFTYFVVKTRPAFRLQKELLYRQFSYSLPLNPISVLNYIAKSIDDILITLVMGKASLGVYNRAYYLGLAPVDSIYNPFSEVLFPYLSKMKKELKKVRSSYLESNQILFILVCPILIVIFFLSQADLIVLFSDSWALLDPILKVVCIIGFLQLFVKLNGDIFKTLDQTKLYFKVSTPLKLIKITTIVFAVYFFKELVPIILSVLVVSVFMIIVEWLYIKRLLKLNWKNVISFFMKPVLLVLFTGTLSILIFDLKPIDSSFSNILLKSISIWLIFMLAAWIVYRKELYSVYQQIKSVHTKADV